MKSVEGKTRISSASVQAPAARSWGGFVILPRAKGVLHVRLTGLLSPERIQDLRMSLSACRQRDGSTTFVLLDATHLAQFSQEVAQQLLHEEYRWRSEGIVTLWLGLSLYMANLLVLVGSDHKISLLSDLETALVAVDSVAGLPAAAAHARLQAWDIMRH